MRNSRVLKAVECCTLLDNMDITLFLELERDGILPKSMNIGIGRRWKETELLEWYKQWKK
jgi:predicted DNA-binding transcriptional regulator AlpA